jgi:hypothetical protein
MTEAEMFQALWARAKAEGTNALYYGDYPPHEEGLEGRFDPDPWGNGTGPEIMLFRVPCPEPRDEPVVDACFAPRELRVFAHEYGHFRSWIDEGRGMTQAWREYYQAGTLRAERAGDLSDAQSGSSSRKRNAHGARHARS